MPLPTNNSRPAIPYQPEQILPNYNRYENLGQFPPTAQQLDGDMNRIIDLLNTQSAEINGIVVGALPGANDPLNANFLLTTDGNGNISWTPINQVNLGVASVGTNNIIDAVVTSAKIQPQAIQTQHIENNAVSAIKIQEGAVTTSKIANNAVTTNKISNNSIITSHLQDNSVTAQKIPQRAIPLSKLATPTSNSIVVGRLGLYGDSFLELPMQSWQIPTFNGTSGVMTSEPLSVVFNNSTDNTFLGRKLSDSSVSGEKIIDSSIFGQKIANGSITGAKLANNTVTNAQILDGTITTALYANRSITGAKIADGSITDLQIADGTITTALYVNGSITGAKIANDTIPKTKLENAGQAVPFSMGYYNKDNGLQKAVNALVTQVSTGLYSVEFTTQQAIDSNYIIILTTENPSSTTLFYAEVAYGTRNITGFQVRSGTGSSLLNLSFNFIVYAF